MSVKWKVKLKLLSMKNHLSHKKCNENDMLNKLFLIKKKKNSCKQRLLHLHVLSPRTLLRIIPSHPAFKSILTIYTNTPFEYKMYVTGAYVEGTVSLWLFLNIRAIWSKSETCPHAVGQTCNGLNRRQWGQSWNTTNFLLNQTTVASVMNSGNLRTISA